MVFSKINPSLEYDESSKIEKVDHNFESLVYPIEITYYDDFGKPRERELTIVFGKKNTKHQKKENVLFFPIYLVVDDTATSKIGLIEIESEHENDILDQNGDIDPEKIPEPLLFSFANEDFFREQISDRGFYTKTAEEMEEMEETEEPQKTDLEMENESNRKDLFSVPTAKFQSVSVAIAQDAIFNNDAETKMPPMLTEETQTMAEELRSEFVESPNSAWIAHFMENNEYKIQDNEGGGDCLFAVVRDAFEQIGKRTTVEKLRTLVADAADDELFQQYRDVYLSMENSIIENNKEIEASEKIIKHLKHTINEQMMELTKEEHKDLVQQAKQNREKIKQLKENNIDNQRFLHENFGFMKNIDSLAKLKEYIKTSSYWADYWTISKLEELLNFKFIIFSEEAYDDDALDGVLNCGDFSKTIAEKGKFSPNYYIMTSYTGNHYKSVIYKKKRLFLFSEIPYDVKKLILNKCMEKNSGIFYLIQDFRNLKSKVGLDPNEGAPEEEEANLDDAYLESLYDPIIVFVLDIKASNVAYPGKANSYGEMIPLASKKDFLPLSKVDFWRRKLHDYWTDAPFSLDDLRWASVEHYYQAAKFKKQNPDFYRLFSLDASESKFNDNVVKARLAGGKDENKFRPKNVNMDPDFYGERNREERKRALEAKFQQNADLKETLKMTRMAKLMNFVRHSAAEIDADLMYLRKTFLN
jgi:predicted NAD-dependent protein-ADP-ribosyltransferase YbiA (DUF1768 family)